MDGSRGGGGAVRGEGGGSGWGGGQGGCERRSEVFVKIPKKKLRGGGGAGCRAGGLRAGGSDQGLGWGR